mgnify:CR=1 FL=1
MAGGRVGDHAHHPAVDEAVLLGDLGLQRQVDLGEARLHHRELGAYQRHRLLQAEAVAHTGDIAGIPRLEFGLFSSHRFSSVRLGASLLFR